MRPKEAGDAVKTKAFGVHQILKQEINPKRKILETFSPNLFCIV